MDLAGNLLHSTLRVEFLVNHRSGLGMGIAVWRIILILICARRVSA